MANKLKPILIFCLLMTVFVLGSWKLLFARAPEGSFENPECPVIAAIPARPFSELSAGAAGEKTLNGTFHDDYLSDTEGKSRIGAREEWGGSVIYFGSGGAN